MKEAILKLFKDKEALDHRLRWTVRLFLLIGVSYLVFFKQTYTETIFREQNENTTRIIVLEHIVDEALKTDSIIKTEYYAIPNYSNATADSLERLITERYKKR